MRRRRGRSSIEPGQLHVDELDVWYVENRSPWLDLKILARTPLALFRGTYKGETGGWKPSGPAS